MQSGIIDLLSIIGEAKLESEEFKNALKRQNINESRAFELRRLYDWTTLRELVHLSTNKNDQRFKLYDLYTLIDLHLNSGQGFYDLNKRFIGTEKLESARRAITLITVMMHSVDYYASIDKSTKEIQQYIDFFKILAKRMQREGLERSVKHELNSRDFYMFSYAIISMNWDPVLLWYIFNAHKEANDSSAVPHVGSPKMPMKLFHDLGHFMGVRKIDSDDLGIWYPMNETAVQRLNDPEHETGRRVRVGKIYFPHGMHGFRECPNCGKLIVYLGDEWGYKSKSLLPPLPLVCRSLNT